MALPHVPNRILSGAERVILGIFVAIADALLRYRGKPQKFPQFSGRIICAAQILTGIIENQEFHNIQQGESGARLIE